MCDLMPCLRDTDLPCSVCAEGDSGLLGRLSYGVQRSCKGREAHSGVELL